MVIKDMAPSDNCLLKGWCCGVGIYYYQFSVLFCNILLSHSKDNDKQDFGKE